MHATKATKIFDAGEWRRSGLNMPPSLFGMSLIAMHAYALGIMMGPLEQEFGWSRSEISAGPLVTSIAALLMAPFAGRVLDRIGPRKVALFGVPFYAIALALLSTAGPSLLSWLLLYVVLAVAMMWIYPTVWTKAIAERFENNRGLALAIALSGTGVAGAVVPLIGSRLIVEFGWRGAYIGLALIAFFVVFPLVYFFFARDEPPKKVEEPAQVIKSAVKLPSEVYSPKFIRLAIAALIYSIGATGLGINAVPILMQEGFTLLAAAEIAGLIGLGTIFGRLIGGFLLDRMDGRYVAVGCGIAALMSASVLLLTSQSAAAASLACVLLGIAAGAEYDACAYLATRHFARRNFGTLFGLISGLSGFGSGITPSLISPRATTLSSWG